MNSWSAEDSSLDAAAASLRHCDCPQNEYITSVSRSASNSRPVGFIEDFREPTITTSKTLTRRDWNYPRPHWRALAAGDMTDFGRAAHVTYAAGAAILAARAYEGVATVASARHSTKNIKLAR